MIEYLLRHKGFVIICFEFISALVGSIIFIRTDKPLFKSFSFFLWFTFLVEVFGNYSNYIHSFSFLISLQNTDFSKNYWLYNFFGIFQVFFYIFFYLKAVRTNFTIKILKWLLVFYFFSTGFILIIKHEDYFFRYINDNFYVGTFCVLICIFIYFYEILQSDKILIFYKSFVFYVSIGLLIWWLVFPPLILYYPYFNTAYPEFIRLRNIILLSVNVFMYSCFIFGFIWDRQK